MIPQIGRLDKFDIRVFSGNLIGKSINTIDQNAREQEIRENDDALVGKFGHMLKAGFNKREGHS